jgi:glutamyl-tRNA synthetase
MEAKRKEAESAKRSYIHRGEHRDTPPAESRRLYEARPTSLRLKVPVGQTITIDDAIRGHVEWQTDTISDPVILRADGGALYNLATVVDDTAMKITSVVRAAEHLSNTQVQMLLYRALGEPLPVFAHVPLVNAPPPNAKEKLSKRRMQQFMTPEVIAQLRACHVFGPELTDEQVKKQEHINPATVEFYRTLGYLPQALVNYLGRLGWSLDDKEEFIPLDRMVANFGLARVNNAPASFDPAKLLWLAGEYMRKLPLEERVAGVIPFLVRAGLVTEPLDAATREKVRKVVEACGDRIKILSDILTSGATFFRKDPQYDPKAVEKKLKKAGAPELLRAFADVLATFEPFAAAALEQRLQTFCTETGANKNLLIHALRVATTGSEVGIGLYEGLVLLGRDETLRRIGLALKLVG